MALHMLSCRVSPSALPLPAASALLLRARRPLVLAPPPIVRSADAMDGAACACGASEAAAFECAPAPKAPAPLPDSQRSTADRL